MYRSALKLLRDPEYVQFLINPEKQKIIVRGSKENDEGSQKIYWITLINKDRCCEFYNKNLIEALHELFYKAGDVHSYRMAGDYLARYNSVIFSFNESVPITSEPEAEEPCALIQNTDMLCTS